MRELDWSRTPVGAVEAWPQSLRTSVSILLPSQFGMYVAWGSDFTQFYNDMYRPILGSTKHPALGKSTRETFKESWHIIGPLFEQVMKGEAVGSDDWLLPLDRHGYLEECHFIFSYSPIRDETGDVGGVLVTVAESTSRVLGERRLRTLRDLAAIGAATQMPEDAWLRSIEALGDNPEDLPFALLYEINETGSVAQLKGAAGIELGHGAAQPRIDLGSEQLPWPIANLAEVGTVIDLAVRFDRLPSGSWSEPPHCAMVLPIKRPGRELPCGVLIAGVSAGRELDDRYREFYVMVANQIGTSIGNAMAYEEERRRAESLAELDRAKTAFFSNISHEFRTPLSLMLGPLEDLIEGAYGEPNQRQRKELETLRRNSLRLLKLVNMLLDFARIEAGRADATFVPVDLGKLTEELAGVFRSTIERAGLRFSVDCPSFDESVYVDVEMWEKIVLNLLSNAYKYTLNGEIAVHYRVLSGGVELEVRDSGIGIPTAELSNVFKRFHRVHNSSGRSVEGTGIGLALVQELVKAHGGCISVKSAVGEGSTFLVQIPTGRSHLPGDRVGAARVRPPGRSHSYGNVIAAEVTRWMSAGEFTDPVPTNCGLPKVEEPSRHRVLVVDDNTDMREYLVRVLSEHWVVDAAPDGAAALAMALRHPPDLVLTDVMMPYLDGFALLRKLRADARTKSCSVVMLSARAGEEARIEGLEAGVDDYLVKPFSSRELVARVNSQLQLAQARRELESQRKALYDLFMQAPLPICVLNDDLVFEMANASYREVVRSEHVAGRGLHDVLPALRSQKFADLLRNVIRSGETYIGKEEPVVLSDRAGKEEEAYFTFIYAPLLGLGGKIDRVMVFAVVVTDQIRARNELDGALRRAEDANRAKDQFLAMLGHELRNPLAPISTAVQLLQLRQSGQDNSIIEIIERQVGHLMRLVDDLMDVSQLARGKTQLDRRLVEVKKVIYNAAEMASPLFEEKQQYLKIEAPVATLWIYGDEFRLTQIVTNLLTNAAKFSSEGQTINVSLAQKGGMAEVRVKDQGRGIMPEMMPHIFDLFFQGAASPSRAGGLGLGLSLVKGLAEMHGGNASARSDGEGQGSEFIVCLPLSDGRNDPANAVGQNVTQDSRLSGVRVLLAGC